MRKQTLSVLLAALLSTSQNLRAESITSLDIVARSASLDCLDWCVTGVCFWLVCTPFPPSCTIHTTAKISHNLPDLTVTAYDKPGDTPWTEMRATTGKVAKTLLDKVLDNVAGIEAGGNIPLSGELGESSLLQFKEAQVTGSPTGILSKLKVPWLCKSKVTPFKPYFMSEVDGLAWRSGLPDSLHPDALIPGRREIGQWPTNTWSPVMPRSGFVTQADDVKASAVVAQRAIDIVTREGQPHIYTPYGYDGPREEVWGDPKAKDKESCDESGGHWREYGDNLFECATQKSMQWLPGSEELEDDWQMISPKVSDRCEAFGAPGEWSTGKQSDDGRYAWNYWRPYKCCVPGPGLFLTSVEITPLCLNQ